MSSLVRISFTHFQHETHDHTSLTTYNVCNNTEINIKKRCYTKQVYIISNFSIILFSIKGNVFSSEEATWLLLSFLYTSPLWYNTRMTTRPRPKSNKTLITGKKKQKFCESNENVWMKKKTLKKFLYINDDL